MFALIAVSSAGLLSMFTKWRKLGIVTSADMGYVPKVPKVHVAWYLRTPDEKLKSCLKHWKDMQRPKMSQQLKERKMVHFDEKCAEIKKQNPTLFQ